MHLRQQKKFWELHRHERFKGTLMQTGKSPYMFVIVKIQYPESFTFLILRILELFAHEFCKFLKK